MVEIQILVADDDELIRDLFKKWVYPKDWRITVVDDGQQALDRLCSSHYDIAILDLYMPEMTGLEVLQAVKELDLDTSFILITGFATREGTLQKAVESMKFGAFTVFNKPLDWAKLVRTVSQMIEQRLPSPDLLIYRIDSYLESWYKNPGLSLSDVAREFNVSRNYVTMLLKRGRGKTFRELLTYYRVQQAKKLLKSTDGPVKAIADQCGYKSRERLCEAFQRLEGISPSEFRQISAGKRKKC